MGNLIEHAKREMKAAGLYDKDADYDGMIPKAVEELVNTFAKQEHSGCSAGIVTSILEKVLRFQPLMPLTGKPEEWNHICDARTNDKTVYQNRRCSHVFAEGPNGEGAYDINGKIFTDPDGFTYTNLHSRVPVIFPYVPKSEYVKVTKEETK